MDSRANAGRATDDGFATRFKGSISRALFGRFAPDWSAHGGFIVVVVRRVREG